MRLTSESLLSYQGLQGMAGLAHVRVYEAPGQLPIVLAGQLDDNPGTMLTMAIEMAAAAIQTATFPDGREFRLIQYEPTDMLGNTRFVEVQFAHRSTRENPSDISHYTGDVIAITPECETIAVAGGEAKEGDYRDPTWQPIDDIERLLSCQPRTWAKGEYTVAAVAGAAGEAQRSQLQAHNRAIGDQLSGSSTADTAFPRHSPRLQLRAWCLHLGRI